MIEILTEAEWERRRLGHATASRIHDPLATLAKGGWAASRKAYASDLIKERLTGRKVNGWRSGIMIRGNVVERKALDAVATLLGDLECAPPGHRFFCQHPTLAWAAATPDALLGDDALVEVKCPQGNTHLDYLDGASIGIDYEEQAQWQMACTGRRVVHWASYDPEWPVKHQLALRTIHRNNNKIAEMEREIGRFLAEVEHRCELMR